MMSQAADQAQLTFGIRFWGQWILANILGYGVGIGLPVMLIDLGVPTPVIIVVLVSMGGWSGLAQWLVLRQKFSLPFSWFWSSHYAWMLACIILPLFFIVYPLLLSFWQWRILRKIFQPAGRWILLGSIGGCSGIILGLFLGGIYYSWTSQYVISVLIGGVSVGLIYALITIPGLIYLSKQEYTPIPRPNSEIIDLAPGQKQWVQTLINLSIIPLLGIWYLILPPLSFGANLFLDLLIFSGIVYIYAYLSVFIHELGHFLFAWVCGSDLRFFAVGRFILISTGTGLALHRTQRMSAGGFAATVPRSLDNLTRQVLIMILGGPVASLLLFCVGTLPLFFPDLIASSPAIWGFTFISGISLHQTIVNMIPMKIGYMMTDGRRLLDLIRQNPEGQRFEAFYAFNSCLRQGIRPRDIDPEIIKKAIAVPETSMDHISGLLMAYTMALDKGETEQAGNYLDQALEMSHYYPEGFRTALLAEGAYFEALIRDDLKQARHWFEQIQERSLLGSASLLRAEAAILCAEGSLDIALQKAQQGCEEAEKDQLMMGATLAEKESIERVIRRIHAQRQVPEQMA